jgi:5'-phosphate synthase pdxT subunit
VLIRQKQILIATFHPELSNDTTVHQYFVDMIRNRKTPEPANNPRMDLAGSGKSA